MKPEYDFSKGERRNFFRPDVELRLPIHPDEGVPTEAGEQLRKLWPHKPLAQRKKN